MENMNISFDTFTPISPSSNSTPRISFSYDLLQSEKIPSPFTRTSSISSVSSDFDFQSKAEVSSYADDLFSDGIILPLPLQHTTNTSTSNQLIAFSSNSSTSTPQPNEFPTLLQTSSATKGHRLRNVKKSANNEEKSLKNINSNEARRGSGNHKSFWRFRRCSSLNFASGAAGLCSFSLLRSKSTGSSPTSSPLHNHNHNGLRSCSNSSPSWKASNDANARKFYYSGGFQRSYGVRIGHVLNFPTPCSMNLFSYLLCSCGYKN